MAFLPPAALVTESACSSRLLHDRIQYTLSSEFIPTTGRLIDQFLPSIVSSYLNGKWMEPGGRYVPSGGWAPAIYGFLPGVMYCFLPFLSTILDADVLLYSTWPSNDSCLCCLAEYCIFFSTLSYGSKCKKHEAISHNISYTYQLVLYSLHPIFMFCAFTSPNQASP